MSNVQLLTGNALDVLKTLPSESVQCIVTSPPFFQQRFYGNKTEIGQENIIDKYLNNLIDIFIECKRVLKNDGSIFIEIGDSFNKKTGSLYGVPQKLFNRLLELNLIARNIIINHKPNAFSQPTKNRFIIDFTFLYFFTKSNKYKFNTQYEPMVRKYTGKERIKFGGNKYPNNVENKTYSGNVWKPNPNGLRLRRSVWCIPTEKHKGIHTAPFPQKLVEIPILACSDKDDMILDPFMGSGTTGLVAARLGRNFIGIDLNEEYIEMARQRIKNGK